MASEEKTLWVGWIRRGFGTWTARQRGYDYDAVEGYLREDFEEEAVEGSDMVILPYGKHPTPRRSKGKK